MRAWPPRPPRPLPRPRRHGLPPSKKRLSPQLAARRGVCRSATIRPRKEIDALPRPHPQPQRTFCQQLRGRTASTPCVRSPASPPTASRGQPLTATSFAAPLAKTHPRPHRFPAANSRSSRNKRQFVTDRRQKQPPFEKMQPQNDAYDVNIVILRLLALLAKV